MGFWDDVKGYAGSHAGSLILGGPIGAGMQDSGLFDPRTEGQYAGVDRSNFDLPYGDDMRRRDQNLGDAYGRRAAPQAADSAYWSGQQQQLGDMLQRQATGQDGSLAAMQLRQATDANAAQQRSLAAGAAPGNAALAQRMAMQNIGRANQGFAQQAGQLGIQERLGAQNALAGLAGQARGQTMQGNQFNVGAQLQQTGLNDAAQGNAYGRGLQTAALQQQGGMSYEGNRTARAAGQLAQPTQGEQELGAFNGFLGGAVKMAKGGIVTKPTPALIGEAGPEAVIPLHELPALLGLAGRTKPTHTGYVAPPPPRPPDPQQATGRRLILPGELSKFAQHEAQRPKPGSR